MTDDTPKKSEPKAQGNAGATTEGKTEGKTEGWKAKLEAHLKEFGPIALVVYLTIWVLVWTGFTIALAAGLSVDLGGSEAGAGFWGIVFAAWVPTKLTQPLRIAATFVITPVVAGIWRRIRGQPPLLAADADQPESAKSDDQD